MACILEGYPHGSVATGAFVGQIEQNLSHSNMFQVDVHRTLARALFYFMFSSFLLVNLRHPAAGPLPWVPEHRWMVIACWWLLAGDYCLFTPCFLLHKADKRLHESPRRALGGPRGAKAQIFHQGCCKTHNWQCHRGQESQINVIAI